ncbi:BON domain-containing protein [Micromonospora sp. WMMD812]|uniref:BON domain-containing protein n=1 Tax=Micromonospora sp. WMMD812 TaxID=3015152 RepID=UPI00248B47DD|nr:BON domain-containing protein [Micromonospora sp. WMMD812]WBB70841.1 BON domain-containing protein [Micromonospora sp. WMMD812]
MVISWPQPDDPRFHPADDAPLQNEDLRLAALVAQRLCVDWTTRRQQIAVAVQNRVVILSGTVASPEARQVAGDLAWDVPGVFDVCNLLRLARPRRAA